MMKYLHSPKKGGIYLLMLLLPAFINATTPVPRLSEKKPAAQAKPVVIGYVGGFRGLVNTDKIAARKLTHINYAFVNVQHNRAVLTNEKTDTINLRKINELKAINPDLKILISIGGWAWSENFSDAVLTDTARKGFAASAVEIIRKYKLDGVDIDWEYPARPGEEGNVYRPEDKQNFTLMFAELRKELDKLQKETRQPKLLTTAVGGFEGFLETSEMGKAAKYLDFVNLMTYDFYSDKNAWHHTNLYTPAGNPGAHSGDKAVKAYIAAGVPAEKLVMGIAFYGRRFKLADSTGTGLGGKIESQSFGKGYTFTKDSLINKNGFRAYRDESAKAPYLFNASTREFITYDDEWSVQHKCDYVKTHKMGGVMFWEYSSDEKEYLLDEINTTLYASYNNPTFSALVLYEGGGHHVDFSKAAKGWLTQLAAEKHFNLTFINNTDSIDDAYLKKYQLFIQLDYAPYNWKPAAAAAFERYIDEGRGGWIGFHHATLLGEFDGFPMWNWFYNFMGGIRFKNYIPDFADGKVTVEDKKHPVMKGITSPFTIQKDEWYTYDKSPRAQVHVLATVDENSYVPASDRKMGDHPVVWTNEHYKAKNVYIFMGHGPSLLDNPAYVQLFRNAIFWAAGK
ncbi:glycosyl hydrolase family 18 protein [Chitinophaga arvensicola]|nr:glycosyl hydrolase family 18 protein [Chitinophaga arvensicola]